MTLPNTELVITIDIGSTWTKGALFEISRSGEIRVAARTQTPTDVNDLEKSFAKIHRILAGENGYIPTVFSSSAKGGLAAAALGIVPELTLKAAQSAACSAGARICHTSSYKLSPSDMIELESKNPDVILFAGGTDGGNEAVVLHNAAMLAKSERPWHIVYAGNRDTADEVRNILHDKKLYICANILPELDRIESDEANAVIRQIFFNEIAAGKGLNTIEHRYFSRATATPATMFDFVRDLSRHFGNLSFGMIDLGGATTDFYSFCDAMRCENGAMFKGMPEPFGARTVEGDLGLRISARSIPLDTSDDELQHYLSQISALPSSLPTDDTATGFDRRLALSCSVEALKRHAGNVSTYFSSAGSCQVQRGRNLENLNFLIVTGGYFAVSGDPGLSDAIKKAKLVEPRKLLPLDCQVCVDHDYLLVHLANLSRLFPIETLEFAGKYLKISELQS